MMKQLEDIMKTDRNLKVKGGKPNTFDGPAPIIFEVTKCDEVSEGYFVDYRLGISKEDLAASQDDMFKTGWGAPWDSLAPASIAPEYSEQYMWQHQFVNLVRLDQLSSHLHRQKLAIQKRLGNLNNAEESITIY